MTVTLTTSKSKDLVILASSSETKNLLTADAFLSNSPSPLHNRMIDSESHSFLAVQHDGDLDNTQIKGSRHSKSSSETKNLVTADAYSFPLTFTTA